MNKERLLNVAKALRGSKNPRAFTMKTYVWGGIGHPCGTPACALGHYASRRDLQDFIEIGGQKRLISLKNGQTVFYDDAAVLDHFDIGWEEANELFGHSGCGGAETVEEAAAYIERFVEEHSR
jgi:hypothetical protein